MVAVLAIGPAVVSGGVSGASVEFMKPHSNIENLSDSAGSRCGVDISGKLVAAALTFSAELHRGEDVDGHFRLVHSYVHALIATLGASAIILVFDGGRFPLKAKTHADRAKKAAEQERLARESDSEAGRPGAIASECREKARSHWKRVLNRGALLALKEFTIDLCLKLGVAYVVAPFEADSQLAALAHWGFIDTVIAATDDSDFIFYGVPLPVPSLRPVVLATCF